jgi:hypothetical protein
MKLIWFFKNMHPVLSMRTSVGISAAFYASQRGRIFWLSWTWSIIPQDHRILCVDETVITAVQHSKFVSTSGKQEVASISSAEGEIWLLLSSVLMPLVHMFHHLLCFQEKIWKRSLWMEHQRAQFQLTIQDGWFGRIIFTKQSDPCTGLQQTQRVSGGWDSQISRHWHMKVVRLSALRTGCLIPQEIFLVRIPVRSQVDPSAIVWPEDRSQRKIPMILSKIEPATFHSAVPQPAAPPWGSIYSSLSRHSIAIGPQTQ